MQSLGRGRIAFIGAGLLTATLFMACGSDDGSSSGDPPTGGAAGALNATGATTGEGGSGGAASGDGGNGGAGSEGCGAGYRDAGDGECAPLLLALEASVGELVPEFSSSVTSYALTLPVGVTTIALTPEVPEGARVSIDGEQLDEDSSWTSKLLSFGDNELEIVVSEAGLPSTSYTLQVTRGVTATYVKGARSIAENRFGERLALSADGKTLVVGAYGDDGDATGVNGTDVGTSDDSGAAYVFVLQNGAWEQQAYLKGFGDGRAGDHFGQAVTLSADGNTLVVGAVLEGTTALSSGAVYVFTRSGDVWTAGPRLKASNAGASDFFGIAVDLSDDGNSLAVGAVNESGSSPNVNGPKNDDTTFAGAVYVFTRDQDTWTEEAYIKSPNPNTMDRFGEALAFSADGSVLAVGARLEDGSASGVGGVDDDTTQDAGAVYVYEKSGGVWSDATYIKSQAPAQGDTFGASVALSGDGTVLAIGANNANGAALASGAVYVHKKSGGVWGEGTLVEPGIAGNADQFGSSVALTADGGYLAVGAPGESSDATLVGGDAENDLAVRSGAVYLFALGGAGWKQTAYVKATNTGSEDSFGQEVALSADGVTLAVGAWAEAGSATGIDGADDDAAAYAGAAYVYR